MPFALQISFKDVRAAEEQYRIVVEKTLTFYCFSDDCLKRTCFHFASVTCWIKDTYSV